MAKRRDADQIQTSHEVGREKGRRAGEGQLTNPSPSSGKISDLPRVAFAAATGSIAEYFDYGLAAPIAALVWPSVFFPQLSSTAALAASLATFGSVYLMRPFGAYLFGRFGDRVGRRAGLMWTLVLMGAGSLGLGLAPSYATVGAVAPLFLIAMRFVQGVGHGGEWGGAATWVSELASNSKRRAFWTGWITFAAPAGNLLAALAFFSLSLSMPRAEFFSYGWRILFATGAVVAASGLLIRWKFVESPLFASGKIQTEPKVPRPSFFRSEWKRVIFLILS
ncbi:MAG TPA: MFS transporter, partial [Nitrososphaerales archaeon]